MTQFFTSNVFADTEVKTSDVFVTATRTPIPKNNVIADTTTITEEEIKFAGSSSLVELLQRQPGIEISNSGGPGKVSTFNIRGTSSNHSVVLIDGLRVDSAFNGLTALQNLSLSQVEKIEIVRGPASSLYGADAIGGVIQIFTKKGISGFNPYLNIGIGSYSTKSLETGARGITGDTNYAINFSGYNTEGFSAFKPNSLALSNSYNLDKDGYNNFSLSGSLSHKFNDNNKIILNLFVSKGSNKYDNPTADIYEVSNFKDKQIQEMFSVAIENKINDKWTSNIKMGLGIDKYVDLQRSLDDFYTLSPHRDSYLSRQNQFSWINNIKLPMGNLVMLYDFTDQKINVSPQPVCSYDEDGNQTGCVLEPYKKTKRNNQGLMIGYLLTHENHNFQANIREDINSLYENSTTGNLGYAFNFNPEWKIAVSYGTAFRSPTFNYAYAPNYSNENLQPEKSKNAEATLKYQSDLDSASFTIFQNKINNLIVTNTSFIPANINNAEIIGSTLSTSHFFGHLLLKSNYTFQLPKNEDKAALLPLRSKEYGNVSMNYYYENWNFGLETTVSGKRYNDEKNNYKISGYSVTNLIADYKINNELTVNFRLNNLFNRDYSLALNTFDYSGSIIKYQTPSSSFFVNLRYEPQ